MCHWMGRVYRKEVPTVGPPAAFRVTRVAREHTCGRQAGIAEGENEAASASHDLTRASFKYVKVLPRGVTRSNCWLQELCKATRNAGHLHDCMAEHRHPHTSVHCELCTACTEGHTHRLVWQSRAAVRSSPRGSVEASPCCSARGRIEPSVLSCTLVRAAPCHQPPSQLASHVPTMRRTRATSLVSGV